MNTQLVKYASKTRLKYITKLSLTGMKSWFLLSVKQSYLRPEIFALGKEYKQWLFGNIRSLLYNELAKILFFSFLVSSQG